MILSSQFQASSFLTFINFGQKYYVTDKEVKNFEEGKAFCHNAGGTLALPRNKEENQALSKLLAVIKPEYLFLGASDQKTESLFLDTEGKAINFFNWAKGEPNSFVGEEDCIIMRPDGDWSDVPCEWQFQIVCELS